MMQKVFPLKDLFNLRFLFCSCFVFLLFFLLHKTTLSGQSIITFEHSGGRFGDNLISYLHAKWLSHTTKIPLQCNYRNFQYASHLNLFQKELDFHHSIHPEKVTLLTPLNLILNPNESVCYSVPYFSEFESELPVGYSERLFFVDWKDPLFRKTALQMISPIVPLKLTLPPKNFVSVALHVRQGGNHDLNYVQFIFPLKLPPLHFYVDALKETALLLNNCPIYCQLFTDSVDPEKIIEVIKSQLPTNLKIVFNYRKEENHDAVNVLDDFFSLFHYDILIRPDSNYSKIPELLHDYMVVVSPKQAIISGEGDNKIIWIDKLDVNVDEVLYESFLNENF